MTNYIGLIITMFLLSMICERVADFLKNYLSEANTGYGYWFRKKLSIGNLLTKDALDSIEEQRRAYRILKINLFCGFFTSLMLHANLFSIIKYYEKPFEHIGWNNSGIINGFCLSPEIFINALLLLLGCAGTGFFISFGSKFWHDLLDILYQTKNYKRILANPETYEIDNIETLNKYINTYQSTYINAVIEEAKPKFMALNHVKGVCLKRDDLGHYIEVISTGSTQDIPQHYIYVPVNGIPTAVNIKVVTLSPTDQITAFVADLGDKIYDIKNIDNFGTIGCIVQSKDESNKNHYLLTCCHNVLDPPTKSPLPDITTGSNNLKNLGKVCKTIFDHEFDAALIELSTNTFNNIRNLVPGGGQPLKPIAIGNNDLNRTKVYVFGAKTQTTMVGVITGFLSGKKIKYGYLEWSLMNLIVASNNGVGIAQAGDSGAIVMDGFNNVVGLIIGGTIYETYILPITIILNKLSIKLI